MKEAWYFFLPSIKLNMKQTKIVKIEWEGNDYLFFESVLRYIIKTFSKLNGVKQPKNLKIIDITEL